MTLSKLRLNANEKGFTLIELMIVIAIIGILAAIAIPNFISYRNKAFCSAAESDAKSIAAAISDYFAIPANVNLADSAIPNGGGVVNGCTFPRLSGLNTAQVTNIAGPPAQIQIVVTDASARCPLSYRQNNASWSQGADPVAGGSTYTNTL